MENIDNIYLMHHYAIEILDCLGIKNPKQEAINDVDSTHEASNFFELPLNAKKIQKAVTLSGFIYASNH